MKSGIEKPVGSADVAANGSLHNRRPFAQIAEGLPDGIAVAADWKRVATRVTTFEVVAFLASFVFAAITGAKAGSSQNYYFLPGCPPSVVACGAKLPPASTPTTRRVALTSRG